MSNISDYENLVYTICDFSPNIISSDLVLQHRGKSYCWLIGTIYFSKNISLKITEALDFADEAFIRHYSYMVYQDDKLHYWYDSQSHPDDPDLQSTHPHHKHVPPDIKHHRLPAPHLSFKEQNLSFLIHEIEEQFF